jgi:hypothetical protein
MEDNRLLAYEAPQVTTYTDEEILEELGQAHAYGRPGNGHGHGPASPFQNVLGPECEEDRLAKPRLSPSHSPTS